MIFKSPLPDIEIPSMGIFQFIQSNPNNINNDKVIFTDGITDEKLTYGEFKTNSKKLAAGLIDKAGFKRGDVLAIFTPNQIDYATVLFGTIVAGGKVTFVNTMYRVEELTYQLKDSKAKYIVASPLFIQNVIKAAAEANIPESNIFLFGNNEINGIKPYSSLISEREAEPVEYSSEESKTTTAYLCYSSGTMGKYKGVEITHYNIVANLSQTYSFEKNIGVNTIYLGVLPCFHIYGLFCLINHALYVGASVVMVPRFDISTFCRVIQDYKVNSILVVPPIVLALVRDPIAKNYDLSSLTLCGCAAAPLSESLNDEFTHLYNIPIKQGYGLTEASPATHLVSDDNIVPGSIGVPIPNVECKVLSETGEELGYNKPGELCVRGPNIMKGYLNNKEATDACIDSEGWFHTGDIVTVDESGNFYIVDRAKELIKYKGYQVAPAELESILITHPSVSDAAVIGVYAEQEATEYPVAYVVLKGTSRSENLKENIKDFVTQRVSNYKKLRGGILFTDKIPRSDAGKILRRSLRDRVKTEHPFFTKQF